MPWTFKCICNLRRIRFCFLLEFGVQKGRKAILIAVYFATHTQRALIYLLLGLYIYSKCDFSKENHILKTVFEKSFSPSLFDIYFSLWLQVILFKEFSCYFYYLWQMRCIVLFVYRKNSISSPESVESLPQTAENFVLYSHTEVTLTKNWIQQA